MSERLIDADELEKRVRDDIRQYDSIRTYNMFNQMKRDSLVEIAERIECAPTVDAVPVEWWAMLKNSVTETAEQNRGVEENRQWYECACFILSLMGAIERR